MVIGNKVGGAGFDGASLPLHVVLSRLPVSQGQAVDFNFSDRLFPPAAATAPAKTPGKIAQDVSGALQALKNSSEVAKFNEKKGAYDAAEKIVKEVEQRLSYLSKNGPYDAIREQKIDACMRNIATLGAQKVAAKIALLQAETALKNLSEYKSAMNVLKLAEDNGLTTPEVTELKRLIDIEVPCLSREEMFYGLQYGILSKDDIALAITRNTDPAVKEAVEKEIIRIELEKMIKELDGKSSSVITELKFVQRCNDKNNPFHEFFWAVLDFVLAEKAVDDMRRQVTGKSGAELPDNVKTEWSLRLRTSKDCEDKYNNKKNDLEALKKTDAFQKQPIVQRAKELLESARNNGISSTAIETVRSLVEPGYTKKDDALSEWCNTHRDNY